MIYFLINNEYQLIDLRNHCKELKCFEKSLIQVPHTLQPIVKDSDFEEIYTFHSPFKKNINYFNFLLVKKNEKIIKKSLNIKSTDILFVYTEYEITNSYIINLFKKSDSKVFLIEDGGIATYLTCCTNANGKLSLKSYVKLFYLKYILNYKYVKFFKYNNNYYPQIDDSFIDAILVYFDVNLKRNIQKVLIEKEVTKLSLYSDNKAIWINQDLYKFFCSKEDFKKILYESLLKLSQKFEIVYFKFHPRENEENKAWQNEIINEFNNIKVINNNDPIENIIDNYEVKYVFSFFSAALLSLYFKGIKTIFMVHLFKDYFKSNLIDDFNQIMHDSGYIFVNENLSNLEDIRFNLKNNNKKIKITKFLKGILYEK